MSAPVRTVRSNAPLSAAEQVLREYALSSLAVVDSHNAPIGVITRSDLLRIGQPRGPRGKRLPALELPDRKIADAMTPEVLTVAKDATVHEACQLLVRKHIHRVFVRDGEALVGVFSTRDAMSAVSAAKVPLALSEFMSSPVLTVGALDPLSHAIEALEDSKVSGLLVLDEFEQPAGLFTQVEALQARELPANTPVEEAMSYALVCLDVQTPMHRAAAHASETRARRVVATERRKVFGILTGIDFARVCAR